MPGWGHWDTNRYWYRSSYRPSSWYWVPGGLGLGYWAYYDPWYGPTPAYGGYGYGGYGYGGYGSASSAYDTGSVRLKVKPRDAQVFVDGYYVGVVDEFDGVFQRLTLGEDLTGSRCASPGSNRWTSRSSWRPTGH